MAPTFCRFGLQESLTLDEVRQLIARHELGPDELLQVGGDPEWKRAQGIVHLQAYFPDAAQPLTPRRYNIPRRKFEAKFTPDAPASNVAMKWYLRIFGVVFGAIALGFLSNELSALRRELAISSGPSAETIIGIAVSLGFLVLGFLIAVRRGPFARYEHEG